MLEILAVAEDRRQTLYNIYELYSYDFSPIHGLDVGEDGRFGGDDLAGCWTSSHRHPYFIKIGDKLAGFAIVDQGSHLSASEDVWDLAEFFVMRRYRRQGVGERAALELFGMFPGQWEIRQSARNTDAQIFWRRVVGRYTGGDFREFMCNDNRWRGPVQTFKSR